ncbi:MAG: type II secretion system GspH family protein [Heliobacteriaceae bacterium]|nr:type II secretion system GspH family protein [Heliobacteriaceae bacterium]
MKKGFTLAEVLITLGIIGVVASLTMPALIGNYRKNVVIVRMQKFYSVFNQALKMSEVDNGPIKDWTFATLYDYDENVEFYQKYLKKHMKVLKYEEFHDLNMPITGVKIYFPDGSAANVDHVYVIFYPVAGKTAKMGRDSFSFIITDNGLRPEGYLVQQRANIINNVTFGCNNGSSYARGRYCAALIMYDNWKISDDYPIKF